MQYLDFNNSESNRLLRQAEKLQAQGADVRFLIQKPGDNKKPGDNYEAREILEKYKLPCRNHFAKLHAKAVILDDAVIIQTKDWTTDAVKRWTDCGLIVCDQSVASYFQTVFASDWKAST